MKFPLVLCLLLFCSTGQAIVYHVKVRTSSYAHADTDANVWIKIHGNNGVTDQIQLHDPTRDDFEKNSEDDFTVEGRDVGRVKGVEIYRDTSGWGDGWHLESIGIKKGDQPGYRQFMYSYWVDADRWIPIPQNLHQL
ncbi:unnamed protein product [Porites evermanni]|uniref:PLAT domain-containing protein n=1 Tax=Porites evermanni TaxID=104178 RepID=A0ABN8LGA6_9CNID|nr:unnamed protein product [Porites evermanni]